MTMTKPTITGIRTAYLNFLVAFFLFSYNCKGVIDWVNCVMAVITFPVGTALTLIDRAIPFNLAWPAVSILSAGLFNSVLWGMAASRIHRVVIKRKKKRPQQFSPGDGATRASPEK